MVGEPVGSKSSELSGDLGPLDKMYRDTSAIAFFTAKDPKAKSNALIVLSVVGAIEVLLCLNV